MRSRKEFDSLLDIRLARTASPPVTPLPIINDVTERICLRASTSRRRYGSQLNVRAEEAPRHLFSRSPGRLRPGQGINRRVAAATATGCPTAPGIPSRPFRSLRKMASSIGATASRNAALQPPRPPRQASRPEPRCSRRYRWCWQSSFRCWRRTRLLPQSAQSTSASTPRSTRSLRSRLRQLRQDADGGFALTDIEIAGPFCWPHAVVRPRHLLECRPTCSVSSQSTSLGRGFLDATERGEEV